MYVILNEYPYEFSEVVGIYDSLDKLNQALEEQDIERKRDTQYTNYDYTKTTEHETYTETQYYSIIQAPVNTFDPEGYEQTGTYKYV